MQFIPHNQTTNMKSINQKRKKKVKHLDTTCHACGQKIPISLMAKKLRKEGMPALAKLLEETRKSL